MDNKVHLIEEEEKEYKYSVIDRIIKVKLHLYDRNNIEYYNIPEILKQKYINSSVNSGFCPFFQNHIYNYTENNTTKKLLQLIDNINSRNLIFKLYKISINNNKLLFNSKTLVETIEPKQVYIHKYKEYDCNLLQFKERKTLTLHINNELWENNCTYWITYTDNYNEPIKNFKLKEFNYDDIKYNTKNINENNEYCFNLIPWEMCENNSNKLFCTKLENF